MEHRRVDIHGHLYQWVDVLEWEAVATRGGGGSLSTGRSFNNLHEALNFIEDKPHFMLVERKCIKAIKIRSQNTQVPETAALDSGQKPQEQQNSNDHVHDGGDHRGNAGDPSDTP